MKYLLILACLAGCAKALPAPADAGVSKPADAVALATDATALALPASATAAP